MSLARNNMIEVRNLVARAKQDIARAVSLMGEAIQMDASADTVVDPEHASWSTTLTNLTNARNTLTTIYGTIYFTPDNPSTPVAGVPGTGEFNQGASFSQ